MRTEALVIVPVLVAGAAGGLVGIAARESDAAFIYEQQHPTQLEPLQVARVVKLAPEPVAGGQGSRAVDAKCFPGPASQLRRNPWRCEVRYASRRHARYTVTLAPDGTLRGVDARGVRIVRGCCVATGR
jgi:hypothetical protein